MARRRAALAGIAVTALGFAAVGSAAQASPGRPLTGRVLVLLDRDATTPLPAQGAPRASASAVARASRIRRARTARIERAAADAVPGTLLAGPREAALGLVTITPPSRGDGAALVRRLRALPGVRHVERERRMTLRAIPDDPGLRELETYPNTPAATPRQWQLDRQGAFRAWDVTRGGGALVGVIDSGIDATHPDLAGKIAATFDRDDTAGSAEPTVDENGHGTHVSSLACAAGDNEIGIVGLGWDCRIIMVKNDFGDGSIAAGITDAVKAGAQAINMSFGDDGSGPQSAAIAAAVDQAYAAGVVLVAAAADEPVEEQGQPANLLQPAGTGGDIGAGKGLTVTSASFSDQRSSFAGRGSQISLAAYGSFDDVNGPPGVLGAFPPPTVDLEKPTLGIPPTAGCNCRASISGSDRYAYLQGTSMAAPQVAAAAAMVKNLNRDLSVADVLRILKRTARQPTGAAGWNSELGWGILDVGAAIATARKIDRTPPTSSLSAPKRVRGRLVTVKLRGRDRAARPGLVASGLRRFEIYASRDGGRLRRVGKTRKERLKLRVRPGARYAWTVVAVDRAGNRERRPRRADARTRVIRR